MKNAGSGIEEMILRSVVNTFGIYYGVEKLYLTIENEPYSSGHITMNKGEFFQEWRNRLKIVLK